MFAVKLLKKENILRCSLVAYVTFLTRGINKEGTQVESHGFYKLSQEKNI